MRMRVLNRLANPLAMVMHVTMHMPQRSMPVRMDVEVAASPTNQQSHSEACD